MEWSMRANDKKTDDTEKDVTKAWYTITIYVASNDEIYYV